MTSIDRCDSRLLTLVLVALSGAAWLLSWPPVNLWAMSFLWAAILVRAVIGARSGWWTALWCLVVYSLCWGWLLRWSVSVSGPGYPAMAIYSACWMVFFVAVYRRLVTRGVTSNWPMAVLAPITWIALEYLRAEIILGSWPWYLAGLPLVNWPILGQVADLGGVWLVSMIVLCLGGAAAEWMRPYPLKPRAMASTIVAGLALVLSLAYGAYRLNAEPGPELGRFLLVQTNLPQDNKIGWSTQQQVEDVQGFLELTEEGMAQFDDVDLIIWPETMLPGIGFDQETVQLLQDRYQSMRGLLSFHGLLLRATAEFDTPMLVGTNTWASGLSVMEDESGRWLEPGARYNSASLLLPDGMVTSYHKVFPTPFGEQLPWIDVWPWLRDQLLDLGARGMRLNLDAGPAGSHLDLDGRGDNVAMATPICFEATVPSVGRRLTQRGGETADLLVNLSNDGWFGDVDGGRLAHAQAARFRCIELRRPMLRCANTGESAWFDSAGRLVASLPMREAGVLLAAPRADSRHTLYVMIGNVVPIACLVLAATLYLFTFRSTRPQ